MFNTGDVPRGARVAMLIACMLALLLSGCDCSRNSPSPLKRNTRTERIFRRSGDYRYALKPPQVIAAPKYPWD